MTNARIARVQGLRSSGAAGPHGRRPTRADDLAEALALEDLEPDEREHDDEEVDR